MRTLPARLLSLLACAALLLSAGCGAPRFMAKAKDAPVAGPGEATVNIIRPSNMGGGQDFPIFDVTAGKLVGNLQGGMRLVYVCPPGERFFVGMGEHRSGVKAELLAGRTYDLVCDVGMGVWTTSVSLRALGAGDERRAQLPAWERKTRLVAIADSADRRAWEAKRLPDAQQAMRDMLSGEKEKRMSVLRPADHR